MHRKPLMPTQAPLENVHQSFGIRRLESLKLDHEVGDPAASLREVVGFRVLGQDGVDGPGEVGIWSGSELDDLWL